MMSAEIIRSAAKISQASTHNNFFSKVRHIHPNKLPSRIGVAISGKGSQLTMQSSDLQSEEDVAL